LAKKSEACSVLVFIRLKSIRFAALPPSGYALGHWTGLWWFG